MCLRSFVNTFPTARTVNKKNKTKQNKKNNKKTKNNNKKTKTKPPKTTTKNKTKKTFVLNTEQKVNNLRLNTLTQQLLFKLRYVWNTYYFLSFLDQRCLFLFLCVIFNNNGDPNLLSISYCPITISLHFIICSQYSFLVIADWKSEWDGIKI